MAPTTEGTPYRSAEIISANEPMVPFDRELVDMGGRLFSSGMLRTQEKGIVKWYDSRLGYGFLQRENAPEVFFHRNRLIMASGESPNVRPQTRVAFDVWRTEEGRLEAQNVRSNWGRPISNRTSGKRYSCLRKVMHNAIRDEFCNKTSPYDIDAMPSLTAERLYTRLKSD